MERLPVLNEARFVSPLFDHIWNILPICRHYAVLIKHTPLPQGFTDKRHPVSRRQCEPLRRDGVSVIVLVNV